MGIDPQHFLDAYHENINAQNIEAVKASPVADALIAFMTTQKDKNWSGTPSQLYGHLTEMTKALNISTRQRAWPKKAHTMGSPGALDPGG